MYAILKCLEEDPVFGDSRPIEFQLQLSPDNAYESCKKISISLLNEILFCAGKSDR